MRRILHSCWYRLNQKFKHGTLIEGVHELHKVSLQRHPRFTNKAPLP
jgi:hypothetical protein